MDPTQSPAAGYEVTPAALAEAARGIEEVLAELRSLGFGAGLAEAGRGVWSLAARTGPSGHPAPGEAFETFCARWEWGVRALVESGREMAEGLAAAGAAYTGADTDQGHMFQGILPVDIDVRADRPWAEVGPSVADTWSAAGRDVAENSGLGMLIRAIGGEDPVQGQLDDVARLHEIVE